MLLGVGAFARHLSPIFERTCRIHGAEACAAFRVRIASASARRGWKHPCGPQSHASVVRTARAFARFSCALAVTAIYNGVGAAVLCLHVSQAPLIRQHLEDRTRIHARCRS